MGIEAVQTRPTGIFSAPTDVTVAHDIVFDPAVANRDAGEVTMGNVPCTTGLPRAPLAVRGAMRLG